MTPRQLHNAVRSLLFTRRTAERLSEVETALKIYLVQQPDPCVTVGEHQIALVGDRLEVTFVPIKDTLQAKLPGVFEEEGFFQCLSSIVYPIRNGRYPDRVLKRSHHRISLHLTSLAVKSGVKGL